ncbi:hypothetical protein ACFSSC_06260 [Corynebacterium mendelii]|uniref:Uncharacterized protein n=1 Tax=Corynebacterium mendelii TaxID=2765362 RepID=A0A939E2I1_9CORY|nr:hypothetical protein [Corynebacterium mendelii]MBN9644583.1 hypothetical protein [Corynebacterium mendelii]
MTTSHQSSHTPVPQLGVGHTAFGSAQCDPRLTRALDNIYGDTWCAPAPSPVGPEAVTVDSDGDAITAVTITVPSHDGSRWDSYRCEGIAGAALNDPDTTEVAVTCNGTELQLEHPLTGMPFAAEGTPEFFSGLTGGLDWAAMTIETALAAGARHNLDFSGDHDPVFGTADDTEATKLLARMEQGVVLFDRLDIDLTAALWRGVTLAEKLNDWFTGRPIRLKLCFLDTAAIDADHWMLCDTWDDPADEGTPLTVPIDLGGEFARSVATPDLLDSELDIRATEPNAVKVLGYPVVDVSGVDDQALLDVSTAIARVNNGTAETDDLGCILFAQQFIVPPGQMIEEVWQLIRRWRPLLVADGVDCPYGMLLPWYLDKALSISLDDDGYRVRASVTDRQTFRRRTAANTLFERRTFGISDRWHPASQKERDEFFAATVDRLKRAIS